MTELCSCFRACVLECGVLRYFVEWCGIKKKNIEKSKINQDITFSLRKNSQ